MMKWKTMYWMTTRVCFGWKSNISKWFLKICSKFLYFWCFGLSTYSFRQLCRSVSYISHLLLVIMHMFSNRCSWSHNEQTIEKAKLKRSRATMGGSSKFAFLFVFLESIRSVYSVQSFAMIRSILVEFEYEHTKKDRNVWKMRSSSTNSTLPIYQSSAYIISQLLSSKWRNEELKKNETNNILPTHDNDSPFISIESLSHSLQCIRMRVFRNLRSYAHFYSHRILN